MVFYVSLSPPLSLSLSLSLSLPPPSLFSLSITHSHTRTRTHTHARARARARAHTHTHTHTHHPELVISAYCGIAMVYIFVCRSVRGTVLSLTADRRAFSPVTLSSRRPSSTQVRCVLCFCLLLLSSVFVVFRSLSWSCRLLSL